MTLCLQNKTYEAEHILTTRNKSIYDANISLHKITAILIIHNAEIKHSTENVSDRTAMSRSCSTAWPIASSLNPITMIHRQYKKLVVKHSI